MNMETSRPLVFSIIEFLKEQTVSGNVTDEAAESIEVAIQCLETAYDLNTTDSTHIAKYKEDISLSNAFDAALGKPIFADAQADSLLNFKEASDEEKIEAAEWKTKGNDFMKEEKYMEALDAYNKAIGSDRKNAVYYCNRAAALSKLNRHGESIDDCHRALTIDPSYSKAYGRMGIAHTALEEHADAQECYRKACELDPDNENYKANLKISQDRLREEAAQSGANMMGPGGFGGFDMSAILNNPGLMNMASQLMATPQVQQMMTNLSSGADGVPDMGSFMSMGQQMANQMQQNNPELVEQLRQQYNTTTPTSGSEQPQNPDTHNQGDPTPPPEK